MPPLLLLESVVRTPRPVLSPDFCPLHVQLCCFGPIAELHHLGVSGARMHSQYADQQGLLLKALLHCCHPLFHDCECKFLRPPLDLQKTHSAREALKQVTMLLHSPRQRFHALRHAYRPRLSGDVLPRRVRPQHAMQVPFPFCPTRLLPLQRPCEAIQSFCRARLLLCHLLLCRLEQLCHLMLRLQLLPHLPPELREMHVGR